MEEVPKWNWWPHWSLAMDLVPSSTTSSRQIEHGTSTRDEASSFPRFPGTSVDWLAIRRLLRSSPSSLAPAICLHLASIGGNTTKKISFSKNVKQKSSPSLSLSLSELVCLFESRCGNNLFLHICHASPCWKPDNDIGLNISLFYFIRIYPCPLANNIHPQQSLLTHMRFLKFFKTYFV